MNLRERLNMVLQKLAEELAAGRIEGNLLGGTGCPVNEGQDGAMLGECVEGGVVATRLKSKTKIVEMTIRYISSQ